MLYTLLKLYSHQNEHEDKLIEGLAYSNGVSVKRMRSAYYDLRHVLRKKTQEQKQK